MLKILLFEPHLCTLKEFLNDDKSWNLIHTVLSPKKYQLEYALIEMYEDCINDELFLNNTSFNIKQGYTYILRK